MKVTKYALALLLTLCAGILMGQTAAGAVSPAPAADAPDQFTRIMTWVLAIAASALFIVAMIYVIKVNQFLYSRVIKLEAAKSGALLPEEVQAIQTESFWTNLRKKYWEDAVPIEKEGAILSHHDFDGIRELDNSLPPWWVNMFIITVIWAIAYMFYYHWGGNGPSSAQEYEQQVEIAKKKQAIALAGKANSVDESSVVALTESGALGEGELIFKNNCVACHGQAGEGTVGPNMTDEYWIHGGGIKNIFKTIKYGVPEKGMISWANQLKPSDMQKVASYILTLQGTNPPNPKAPQGTIWKEEVAPADSTAAPTTTTGTPSSK